MFWFFLNFSVPWKARWSTCVFVPVTFFPLVVYLESTTVQSFLGMLVTMTPAAVTIYLPCHSLPDWKTGHSSTQYLCTNFHRTNDQAIIMGITPSQPEEMTVFHAMTIVNLKQPCIWTNFANQSSKLIHSSWTKKRKHDAWEEWEESGKVLP